MLFRSGVEISEQTLLLRKLAFVGETLQSHYLHAFYLVAPDLLGVIVSTEVLIWVAIGGRGSLIGPVIATLIVTQASHGISSFSTSLWPLILGALFLLVVFALPDGLASLLRKVPDFLSRRRGSAS